MVAALCRRSTKLGSTSYHADADGSSRFPGLSTDLINERNQGLHLALVLHVLLTELFGHEAFLDQ